MWVFWAPSFSMFFDLRRLGSSRVNIFWLLLPDLEAVAILLLFDWLLPCCCSCGWRSKLTIRASLCPAGLLYDCCDGRSTELIRTSCASLARVTIPSNQWKIRIVPPAQLFTGTLIQVNSEPPDCPASLQAWGAGNCHTSLPPASVKMDASFKWLLRHVFCFTPELGSTSKIVESKQTVTHTMEL